MKDKANSNANWSLGLALASLTIILWWFTALPAYIFGIVALRRIARGESSKAGRLKALAGATISAIVMVVMLPLWLWLIIFGPLS